MQNHFGLLILDVMPIYMIIALDIVIIICSSINCPTVICLPAVCYFSREKPLVKSRAPGSIPYHICFPIYFYSLVFSDLLFQKPKNTLLHFLFSSFILRFIEIYLSNLSQFLSRPHDNFWHRYPLRD